MCEIYCRSECCILTLQMYSILYIISHIHTYEYTLPTTHLTYKI